MAGEKDTIESLKLMYSFKVDSLRGKINKFLKSENGFVFIYVGMIDCPYGTISYIV